MKTPGGVSAKNRLSARQSLMLGVFPRMRLQRCARLPPFAHMVPGAPREHDGLKLDALLCRRLPCLLTLAANAPAPRCMQSPNITKCIFHGRSFASDASVQQYITCVCLECSDVITSKSNLRRPSIPPRLFPYFASNALRLNLSL